MTTITTIIHADDHLTDILIVLITVMIDILTKIQNLRRITDHLNITGDLLIGKMRNTQILTPHHQEITKEGLPGEIATKIRELSLRSQREGHKVLHKTIMSLKDQTEAFLLKDHQENNKFHHKVKLTTSQTTNRMPTTKFMAKKNNSTRIITMTARIRIIMTKAKRTTNTMMVAITRIITMMASNHKMANSMITASIMTMARILHQKDSTTTVAKTANITMVAKTANSTTTANIHLMASILQTANTHLKMVSILHRMASITMEANIHRTASILQMVSILLLQTANTHRTDNTQSVRCLQAKVQAKARKNTKSELSRER